MSDEKMVEFERTKAKLESIGITRDVLTGVWEVIDSTFRNITKSVNLVYISVFCKNRKVVDLALHHPKERVRKKNINRARRIIRKQIKNRARE